jgi:hypothetical protein
MEAILTSLTNPIWADAEHTAIDCLITTSQFGVEVLPFRADQNDVAAHGRAIFDDLVAGKYGAIADYIPPEFPIVYLNQPISQGAQTL